MRKRRIKVEIYLDEAERGLLRKKQNKSGLSVSALFRRFIRDEPIRERPNVDVFKLYAELSHIGGNINQIARIANSTGIVQDYQLQQIKVFLAKAVDLLDEKAV